MNRSIAVLMLVQFVAQHFACCCTGCEGAPQQSNQVVSVSKSGQRSCRSRGCCHRHPSRDTQTLTHNSPPAKSTTPASRDPQNGSSQHHLCFASHIVFNATGRAIVTPSEWSSGHFLLLPESTCRKLVELSAAERLFDGSKRSSLTCYERSLLGVYRI